MGKEIVVFYIYVKYIHKNIYYKNIYYIYAHHIYIWHAYIEYINTMKCYSAIKKKETLPFVTIWMDLEGIMLSEISHTEKDKCCMISLICGIFKKIIDTANRLVVARGRGGRWEKWEKKLRNL